MHKQGKQWNIKETPEIDPNIHRNLVYNKKDFSGGSVRLFNK
jgi:hypothetical protein